LKLDRASYYPLIATALNKSEREIERERDRGDRQSEEGDEKDGTRDRGKERE